MTEALVFGLIGETGWGKLGFTLKGGQNQKVSFHELG